MSHLCYRLYFGFLGLLHVSVGIRPARYHPSMCAFGSSHALNELLANLDDTYQRALQEVPEGQLGHAHRLLQCLVPAIRSLCVKELAEIFAVEFGLDGAYNVMECWRPENPEEAILSACSTLIAVVDV